MKRLLLATVAVALLAGCAQTPVTGMVVDRRFERGRCTVEYVTTKTTTAKGVTTTHKPRTRCTNDDYELDVRGDDGKVRRVDVDRHTYETLRLGDRYPR